MWVAVRVGAERESVVTLISTNDVVLAQYIDSLIPSVLWFSTSRSLRSHGYAHERSLAHQHAPSLTSSSHKVIWSPTHRSTYILARVSIIHFDRAVNAMLKWLVHFSIQIRIIAKCWHVASELRRCSLNYYCFCDARSCQSIFRGATWAGIERVDERWETITARCDHRRHVINIDRAKSLFWMCRHKTESSLPRSRSSGHRIDSGNHWPIIFVVGTFEESREGGGRWCRIERWVGGATHQRYMWYVYDVFVFISICAKTNLCF